MEKGVEQCNCLLFLSIKWNPWVNVMQWVKRARCSHVFVHFPDLGRSGFWQTNHRFQINPDLRVLISHELSWGRTKLASLLWWSVIGCVGVLRYWWCEQYSRRVQGIGKIGCRSLMYVCDSFYSVNHQLMMSSSERQVHIVQRHSLSQSQRSGFSKYYCMWWC